MKRVLTVVLTVVLTLGLAVSAFAGELVLGGKEAGVEVVYTGGNNTGRSIWINVGSLDFKDGSFVFHLSDLKVSYEPRYPTPTGPVGTDASDVKLNIDYGKWYAKTGDTNFVFTLSNDRGNWVGYKGFLKPSAKVKDDDPHRTLFLVTGNGTVAGLDLGFNLYETENGVKDMNLTAAKAFDNIKVAGFVGDFNGTDYYGGDVTLSNLAAGANVSAGVYANTGDGLAYRLGLTGLVVGPATIEADYQFGNANVVQSTSWKDGNVPGKDTQKFFAKAVAPFESFGYNMKLTGEFTYDFKKPSYWVKLLDQFDISDLVKSVALEAGLGNDTDQYFQASAGIYPVAGLEVWPRAKNVFGGALELEAAAQYKVSDTILRGGVLYKDGLDRYFIYGDSKLAYEILNTQVAGMYLKKDITGTAKYYTRAFAKATANVTEELTDVGVKFLYKDDNGTTSTRVAVGGKYAISPDTSLELSYRIFDRAGHAYAALTKTVGSATFTLSYGDNVGYEGSDDGHVHEPSWKKWITGGNVPWRELNGVKSPVQNTIRASAKVFF